MKYRNTSLIVMLFSLILIVFSCGSDSSLSENQVTFKRTDNEVIARLLGSPDRLNPLLTGNGNSTTVLYQTHSYLLFPDLKTFEMQPQLAKSLPVVEEITSGPYSGGMKYTFEIHDPAVWDNGTPITGNDVVFTWKALSHPSLPLTRPYRPYLSFVADVEVDPENPKKFTVYTREKYFIAEEALGALMFILPEYNYDPEKVLATVPFKTFMDVEAIETMVEGSEALQQFAKDFMQPKYSQDPEYIVGSGPYKLVKWEADQELVLEKKENWWGDALATDYPALVAHPERIVFKPIPNAATALAALKAEEIDIMARIDPKDYNEMKEDQWAIDHYNLSAPDVLQVFLIHINNQDPKLRDKRVRKALAHATDINGIIENVYYGYGRRTTGTPYPDFDYYNKELPLIDYDVNKAKQLLEEAGWQDSNGNGVVDKVIDGEVTELSLNYQFTANRESSLNTAQLLQNDMKAVGVDLVLEPLDFREQLNRLRQGDFDLASGGRSIQYIPWEPRQSFHSDAANGGQNYARFINAEADRIMEEIKTTVDSEKRNQLYKALQAIIYEEQPVIYLFNPVNLMAIHKRFDATITPISPGFFVPNFELKPSFAQN